MTQEVVPGETGWIDCVTNKRHTFQVRLPRLCVAFAGAADGPLPAGRVRLHGGGADEAVAFASAAPGDEGALEVGFQGASAAEARYDAEVEPAAGRPYPLFAGRSPGARARRPSRGAPVLARAAALRLAWRGATPADALPVAGKHVALELPAAGGPVFHAFVTDAAGLLRLPGGEPAWLDGDARRLRVAVLGAPLAPGQRPPAPALQEVEVEAARGDGGREERLARLRPPPRLSLPITITPAGGQGQAEASRAFLRDHAFEVQLGGRTQPSSALLDGRGRIEVVFRCEPGAHDLRVSSHALGAPSRSRHVWYARRITVTL